MNIKITEYTDDGYVESTDDVANFIELKVSSDPDGLSVGFGRLCDILAHKGILEAKDITHIAHCYPEKAELI